MDPPQPADAPPPAHPSPPAKRVKVDTSVNVNIGGENVSISPSAFSRLENFITDKISQSEKKSRYAIVYLIILLAQTKTGIQL